MFQQDPSAEHGEQKANSNSHVSIIEPIGIVKYDHQM